MVLVLVDNVFMRGLLTAKKKMSNYWHHFIWTTLLSALIAVPIAHAQFALTPMNAPEIQRVLFGQSVTGEYPSGRAWAEHFKDNGTSTYVEAGRPVIGKMRFNGNALCFTYPPSSGSVGGCFEVWRRGENCFDFYSSQDGRTISSKQEKQYGHAWSARAWIPSQKSTCQTELIS